MQDQYLKKLSKLEEIRRNILNVHALYKSYYPVTIVSNDTFQIYDVRSEQAGYEHIKSEPCPFPIPQGVRAAFPLDCYDNKMSAIVSDDVFDTMEGYVAILHEFVHCAQGREGEAELRGSLMICQEYRKRNDYMWEINHPFPYTKSQFVDCYTRYMRSLSQNDYAGAICIRQELGSVLGEIDREYLVWQEWKEGLARYLENKIRMLLDIGENHSGKETPYSRVSFYESGSRFIALLERANPNITENMQDLFFEMAESVHKQSYYEA